MFLLQFLLDNPIVYILLVVIIIVIRIVVVIVIIVLRSNTGGFGVHIYW